MAELGIVIPAHNEAETIRICLASLEPFRRAGDIVVVVDACSGDETGEVARAAGAWVLTAGQKSRGRAVALGVEELLRRSDGLQAILIAHADMTFSPESRTRLLQALRENPQAPGGALGHRIDHPRWIFRWIEAGNTWRARWAGMPYGDQAQFFRPSCLEGMGGFPQQEQLEDVELSLRLRRLGPLIPPNAPVRIPARHWNKGIVRTTIRNWLTVAGYVTARSLHRLLSR